MPISQRAVTERDFRQPKYLDADPEDYEFREDGAIVRKDRWRHAVSEIQRLVLPELHEYEIHDVVEAVERLVADDRDWTDVAEYEAAQWPFDGIFDLRLDDGSILRGAVFSTAGVWSWRDSCPSNVVAFRETHTGVGGWLGEVIARANRATLRGRVDNSENGA